MCASKVLLLEKLFRHVLHWNGFSPLCLIRWNLRALSSLNCWRQCSHLKGLSPVWIRVCLVRWLLVENLLSHVMHKKTLSSAHTVAAPEFSIQTKQS